MENDPLYLLLQFPKGASPPVEPEELLQGACPGGLGGCRGQRGRVCIAEPRESRERALSKL